MYSLGIDIGSSSIKLAMLNAENAVIEHRYLLHKGKVPDVLSKMLKEVFAKYDKKNIIFGAVTGSGSKFLIQQEKIDTVNEVSATIEGAIHTTDGIGSIIEIGGQNAKYITGFSDEDKSKIKISMNSSCSAGTGSFIEEQISRLDLNLNDYETYAEKASFIPRIAGRCSVFAKTDITHHQQEGVSIENILMGLAHAMVKSYRGTVMGKLPRKKPILFAGGVGHNKTIINVLKEMLKLKSDELILPEHFSIISALGAALIANKEKIKINVNCLFAASIRKSNLGIKADDWIPLPPLVSFGADDSIGKHAPSPMPSQKEPLNCCLGIDIGSTSTNLVLINEHHQIIWSGYFKTRGNPVKIVKHSLKEIKKELGEKINIVGVGTTGSGRHLIARLFGADVIIDEITSQAKAAVSIDSSVDTIIEIGGQDSKFISLKNGAVSDFQMNKICAAGTGSFIEEQALKFNMNINDFGDVALGSTTPVNLGERCTVFIETTIAAHLAMGAELKDIASGLCYSVAKNYLNKVVGQKTIGNKIFFQGGVAYNQGVINAFRAITGKDIVVPPFFSVTGAYGVAIIAGEETGFQDTMFKGFDLNSIEVPAKKHRQPAHRINNSDVFNKELAELIFKGYTPPADNGQKTVGIPRALFTYGLFPMFFTFFKNLGFNVLLSEPTSEKTIRLGQEYSLGEACYPVKLINGHVAELVEKQVDYIFFPDLYTVDHPGSRSRQNYGCAYMQLAFKVISQTMELKSRGIELLAPTIAFNLGKAFMMKSFSALGKQLGTDQGPTLQALGKGMKAFHAFEERLQKHGEALVRQLKPDEKAFVLISKIYGVADPVLNMGIPGKLMDMGYKVLGFYDLPEGDIFDEHPNMYWPFGEHILEPAYLIKEHPNLYAIFLTHHGCGPDSVLTHYFREIMGDKPYLNIEVDEHSSDVGVITRIEAFVNSLGQEKTKTAQDMDEYMKAIAHEKVNIRTGIGELKNSQTLLLPNIYPYSRIFEKILQTKGINAKVVPETSQLTVDKGKKHTLTNEYLSLSALLGDILNVFDNTPMNNGETGFLIPQTEGAEIDGQTNRFVRTKLNETGYGNVQIFAPFVEDALRGSEENLNRIFLGLIAGDLIRFAPPEHRETHLHSMIDSIDKGNLEFNDLLKKAEEINREVRALKDGKKILAIGEVSILYNDFLNNFTFKNIENNGHRVLYSPLSECIWCMWKDFADQNPDKTTPDGQARLDQFSHFIHSISEALSFKGPFEKDIKQFIAAQDRAIGYYSGAFGRYRAAKMRTDSESIDGIISVASTYENTEISLNILQKGFEGANSKPVLNLSFDGNKNENDKTKTDSFLYYL